MSTANLSVWITEKGHPCRIDNSKNQLYVYVLHCDGQILEWCGKKYVGLQARCGHLDLKLPVGCYIVGAVEKPIGKKPLGNHLTHIAVVRVNCGDQACVTLFNPTLSHCGHWFLTAMTGHLAAGGEALTGNVAEAMRTAVQAVERLLTVIPVDDFTRGQAQVTRLTAELGSNDQARGATETEDQ